MGIPIYELGHTPLTVHLANQQRVTITDCLKGVDVEFQGHCIKTDLWIHDDSDTEDISLGSHLCSGWGSA